MAYVHTSLANGQWHSLSLMEQLGNVGSEVERAIRWRNKGQQQFANNAMERALELLDLTMSDPQLVKASRLKEVCRMRELLCDWFYGDNEYGSTDAAWQKYFLAFAVAARRKT